jgi:hypothetical protein
MYAGTGSDGKRRYTVDEIAGTCAVSRKTTCRHLDQNHAQRQPDKSTRPRLVTRPRDSGATSPAITPAAAGTAVARARPQRQRSGLTPARWPALPADTSPPAGPKRSGNARISRSSGSAKTTHPGRSASTGTARAASPGVECGTVECAHRGDGPVLTGTLVDQLRKHDPNQPAALRAWLTSHGWQLEPEPLCPAHSNSIK